MESLSIRRVVHYARYHYSATYFRYLSLFLVFLAMPMLIGVFLEVPKFTYALLVPNYLFGGVAMAIITTRSMRGRGTKVLDGVLPVTSAERHLVNVFNLVVVFPLLFVIISTFALGVVALVSESSFLSFALLYEDMLFEIIFNWPVYVFVQIVCSISLLINLLARRSLILAYIVAYFGSIALCILCFVVAVCFFYIVDPDGVDKVLLRIPNVVIEIIIKIIYCMIPVGIYALDYVVLRRRQVKW
jgi:hypothetical protein